MVSWYRGAFSDEIFVLRVLASRLKLVSMLLVICTVVKVHVLSSKIENAH